jgi:DNA polymerase-3 subunit epsilon
MANDNLLILGIDLEGINADLINSGVNTKVDRVTEVGAVLWHGGLEQPVKILSELINEEDHLPITEEVEELTGINDKMLEDWGLKGDPAKQFLIRLLELVEQADYLMAHNAHGYDKPMLKAMYQRYGLELPDKVWIDTFRDVEFPKKIHGRSLALLEHAHGFLNPFPHRAVTDVMAMLKIASQYSLRRMSKLAESPMERIIAPLSPPNWRNIKDVEEFNKVKSKISRAKFRWKPENKTWSKEIHKILLDEGKVDFDFEWYIGSNQTTY